MTAGVIWGYYYRNDEALGRLVGDAINGDNMRGRIHFGSLHWTPRAIWDIVTGQTHSAHVKEFRIYDPRGRMAVRLPYATAEIDLWALVSRLEVRVSKIRGNYALFSLEEYKRADGEKEIGLFTAFNSKTPSPPSGKRGPQLVFEDAIIKAVDIKLAFIDWTLKLKKAPVDARYIRHLGGDVAKEGLQLDGAVKAKTGELSLLGQHIPLSEVDIKRGVAVEKDQNDIALNLRARFAGSPVRVRGRLADIFQQKPRLVLQIEATESGALLAHLTDGLVGGPHGIVRLRTSGSLVGPKVEGSFRDLVVTARQDFAVDGVRGRLWMDLSKPAFAVREVKAPLWGGTLEGTADANLREQSWQAKIKTSAVNPGRLVEVLAGRLDGTVALGGGLGEGETRGLVVVDLDLQRDRRRADLLPRQISAKGTAHIGPQIIDFSGVTFRSEGARATVRGSVNVKSARTNLRVQLAAPTFGAWLRRRGIPPAVAAANGEVYITGTFPRLRGRGSIEASRVGYAGLRLPKMTAGLKLAGGEIELADIRAAAYGGKVRGNATLSLFAPSGDVTSPRRQPEIQGELQLDKVDIGALTKVRSIKGKASASLSLGGPLASPSGTGNIKVADLTIGDDSYASAEARFGLLPDRVTIYRSQIRRAGRGGGALSLWGDAYYDGRLAMRASARRFPLRAIPGISEIPLRIDALIDGQVTIGGAFTQPRISGKIGLARTRFRDADLQSGTIVLTPGSDTVRITGHLFRKHIKIDGFMMMQPVPRLHLRADLASFPIHRVLPEVEAVGDVTAVATGQVQLDADAVRGLTWASARFPKVEVVMSHQPPGSRKKHTVRLTNQQPLAARFIGGRLDVVSARLVADSGGSRLPGEFTLAGWLSNTGSDMWLRGRIALKLVEFFLARRVRQLSGLARANVHITGPLDRIRLSGNLSLDRVVVGLPKFDRNIEIPRGRILLSPGELKLQQVPIVVEKKKLVASGRIMLEQLVPDSVDLQIAGEFNARLLRLLLSEQLSHANGSARVRLALRGPLRDPRVRGRLEVARLEMTPRATGRTLSLRSGTVAFSNYLIKTIKPLEGTYDEGRISISGRLRHDNLEPMDIALEVNGSGIAARQPKVYLAEANIKLKLFGDSSRLSLVGDIDLVDARYVREFDIVKNALFRPRSFEEERPFWQGNPLLSNLELKLAIRSAGPLTVKNRYGELSLDGTLAVSGTLADPRVDGQVRVEEGRFRVPFLHGIYTLERGEIDFDRDKNVDEAKLDITAENRIERGGEDYLIRLQLRGPLVGFGIQLSSEPELEQGQIMTLLATGRTTDQLRSQLRGEGGSAAGAADEQVKQVTGDLIGNIVEDQLRKVLRLDLFRLELGTETVRLRTCKNFGRYLQNCFRWERGLATDDDEIEATGEWLMHDYLRLVGRAERLTTRIETEDENDTRVRLELKARFRLR